MERTLTLETRVLKAVRRQWEELSPEVTREISMRTRFAHRTAPLIKDLEFTRLPQNPGRAYRPARLHLGAATHALFLQHRLQVGAAPHALCLQHRLRFKPSARFLQHITATRPSRMVSMRCRHYDLPDFGNAEYDRYQIESDHASGITLGRVAGTERWGHQP